MKEKKIIDFISTFEMYDKEESGIKPNTIRCFRGWSSNKKLKVADATHVRIRRGYTTECFTRKITDKTEWDEWIVLSWNPNGVEI